jgi:Zn-dependent M28 family amino/carboxypeptidase
MTASRFTTGKFGKEATSNNSDSAVSSRPRGRSAYAGQGVLLASALAFLVSCAGVDQELPPLDATLYEQHIVTLSSDEFEGRKPGTAGERKTLDYLVKEFEQMGLKPGNGDSYLQPVPFVEITPGSDTALRIGATDLRYGEDMVLWTKRLENEINVEDSPVVFVGYGIVAPEYGWDDYEGLDVRGKTVVMLINDPGFATQDPELFRGNAMTYYGRWTYKFEEAARQGAAAALIVHDDKPAAYPWGTVQNSWMGPQLDMVAADGNASRVDLEGWISLAAAESLFQANGSSYQALREAASRPGFKPIPLKERASGSLRNLIRRGNSANVAAVLPGTERPDEFIVYMAHWDHLGRSLARTGDNIFNGALDNATGTAGLLTLARAFTQPGQATKRSVLFLAVTLEESGLLGSAYYAANPLVPLTQTVAALNMDAISWGGPTRDVTVVGSGSSQLEEYLTRAASTQDRVVKPEPTPENGFFFRSDHFNFAKVGVPALYIKLGIDDREQGEAFGRERQTAYTLNDYHKPSDEYRPGMDLRGGLEDLALLQQIGAELASNEDFPQWYEGSEFRAARERSFSEASTSAN